MNVYNHIHNTYHYSFESRVEISILPKWKVF